MKQKAKQKHKTTCFSLSDSRVGGKFQFSMKVFTIDLLRTRPPAMFCQANLETLAKLSISLTVKPNYHSG